MGVPTQKGHEPLGARAYQPVNVQASWSGCHGSHTHTHTHTQAASPGMLCLAFIGAKDGPPSWGTWTLQGLFPCSQGLPSRVPGRLFPQG